MPSYHYKLVYRYTKTTPIDVEPRDAKHHDDDSTRRRRKRHSSSSSRREFSGSRNNDSFRPLWVTVIKIDNHFGMSHSESGKHRHRDDEKHSHGHRSRSSRHSRQSDVESEYGQARQNGSGPPSPSQSRPHPTQPSPSPPLSPRPKPHATLGLNMTSFVPSYVDAGTSTLDYWYYPTQTVVYPNHQAPVSPPPPYTSIESLYGCWPSMFEVPACGLTYCGNQVANSGYSHGPCVTMPMVMCTACCQASALQGYPCLEGLRI